MSLRSIICHYGVPEARQHSPVITRRMRSIRRSNRIAALLICLKHPHPLRGWGGGFNRDIAAFRKLEIRMKKLSD